jgi:6-pyruvoyltetrahydropterin/6-carboxytetrahydropterin synthase
MPRVELTRDFGFEAAHRLPWCHPSISAIACTATPSGITIAVAGEIDERMGWLIDFDVITKLVEPIVMGELTTAR